MLLDIAINKTAVQSSTFENNEADGAVDGNRGTDLKEDFCTHTGENDTNPWWMVDLQATYYITAVRILNRGMDKYGVGRKTKQLLYKLRNTVDECIGLNNCAFRSCTVMKRKEHEDARRRSHYRVPC